MGSGFRRRLTLAGLGASALAIAPGVAAQQDYPARPIQLIQGFGVGGNADVIARILAAKLQDYLKQAVIVESKAGAGGSIASSYVAKAKPDGYTLVMLTGAHSVSAALRKTLPYDPIADFSFITTVSSFPFVIAVRAEHPAKTLADLLAMAKQAPGKLTFTSAGMGSTQHMTGELLAATAGVQLLHVPYRGGGAPVQAVLAGDVDILADTLTVAMPHISSGRLRALAITSANQWPILPSIPPASATLPGFEVRSWLGLAAPAGTPEEVVRLINREVLRALQAPDLRNALGGAGSVVAPSSPDSMRSLVQQEILRWRAVIEKVGIPLQD